jgi:serine O-acetyltransferase
MLASLSKDAERYRRWGGWYRNVGFYLVASYRLGAWARSVRVPVVRHALIALAGSMKAPLQALLHVELPSRARIGPGFALFHAYNVFVGSEVVIGEGCTIYHEVTLGAGSAPGEPRIGDHVVVFAGARVLGGISVGERAEIGANCVVTRDVPAHSLVVPPLPRILPQSIVPRAASPAPGESERRDASSRGSA